MRHEHKIAFVGIVFTGFVSAPAVAADCASDLRVEQGAIGKIIQCLADIEQENAQLKTQLAALTKSQAAGTEAKDGAAGPVGPAGPQGPAGELPAGAVVAFNRSESSNPDNSGACPSGWTLFREAGGRVIVGAGQHDNSPDVPTLPSYLDNRQSSVGGQQSITITGQKASSLDAPSSDGYSRNNHDTYRAVTSVTLSSPSTPDYVVSNMQPYIALYYCTKAK